jgi:nicotinate-nucleotide pyrophosphorylase (carboxylating)
MTKEEIIRAALEEDIGDGDHSSLATVPRNAAGKVGLFIKEAGVLCGIDTAITIYRLVDPAVVVQVSLRDGQRVVPGDMPFTAEGPSVSLLTAERTVLNFLQRMSGIATQTRRYADALQGLHARVLDTRKTTPNMRSFEKCAVRCGGGENHRMGLYDMIMIKDNHVDFAGGISHAIYKTSQYQKEQGKNLLVEIEVRNLEELEQVLRAGSVHRIMLDNFTVDVLRTAVQMIDGRFETEASGGITLDNIREYAETGVDYISVGALTHQIKSLDMSLKAIL